MGRRFYRTCVAVVEFQAGLCAHIRPPLRVRGSERLGRVPPTPPPCDDVRTRSGNSACAERPRRLLRVYAVVALLSTSTLNCPPETARIVHPVAVQSNAAKPRDVWHSRVLRVDRAREASARREQTDH